MQVAFQNDNCSLFSPPKKIGRETCVDLKQARPSVAKVAQIAYEVAEQFPQLQTLKTMEEYNNTRMALLRGSFTDEEERDKD